MIRNVVILVATAFIAIGGPSTMAAPENRFRLFVATDGNDANLGSRERPVKTLERAKELVRKTAGTRAIEVIVAAGSYYLAEPLVLSDKDSGTKEFPVVWRAQLGCEVRFVGGQQLKLRWEPHTDRIYKASVPAGTQIDQLFLKGKRQILARYPNYDPKIRYYCGHAATVKRMAGWKKPETAYIHALHRAKWGSGHIVLKRDGGKLYEYMVSIDTTTQGNNATLNDSLRFAENVFEELDSDKEWFFDKDTSTLFYQPVDKGDLDKGLFEAVANPHLVRLAGTSANPAGFITLNGFTFCGAAPTWKLTKDHLPNGGDFVVHRGGALTLDGTVDCTVKNCTFTELGGNAVFINAYNRRASVVDCLIRNVGANGIALCGAAETMRGDQFYKVLDETIKKGILVRRKWETPEGWSKQPDDLTPGPKTENYPSECLIKGNLITVSGEYEKQSAAILLSMTRDNTISHNTAYNLPRAGICMNDCSWSGNIFEHNDIFDTVRETADHGPFNSWGKDRYWIWANHDGRHSENPNAGKHCLIDAVKPNHIRNNRLSHPLRSTHSWGIDLDDGSTNLKIYNNLTLGCAVKLREGFHRTVENNIFIGAGKNIPGRHICFPDNKDVFRRNIVVNISDPAVVWCIRANPKEMAENDRNCYFTPGQTPLWAGLAKKPWNLEDVRTGLKHDMNSIDADPMFVDPASGDYRVRPESPALKLGFKNFPMEFGVTAPRLLKLLPERTFLPIKQQTKVTTQQKTVRSAREHGFMGSVVKNMTEEAEKTVVGIGSMTGVLILKTPTDSPMQKAGLRVGDLIIACGGKKVHSVEDLVRLSRVGSGDTIEIQVHDDSRVRKYMVERDIPLSQGKPCKASSTWPEKGYEAGKAFDGD